MDADHIITNLFCQFCPLPLWVRWPFHLKNHSDWDASIGADWCLCQFALSVSFKETLFGQKKICIVPGKYSLYGPRKNSQCNSQKKIFFRFHKKSILVLQIWNQNLFWLTFFASPGNFLLLSEEEREEWIVLHNSSKYLQKPVSIVFFVQTCQVITMCLYCAEL